jgi:hypothetical protein
VYGAQVGVLVRTHVLVQPAGEFRLVGSKTQHVGGAGFSVGLVRLDQSGATKAAATRSYSSCVMVWGAPSCSTICWYSASTWSM